MPADAALANLRSRPAGLSYADAAARLKEAGPNTIDRKGSASAIGAFFRQFRSPLVLILIFAAIVSAFVGEGSEAIIIGAIVLASCVLTFTQEYGASKAMGSADGPHLAQGISIARWSRGFRSCRRDRGGGRHQSVGRKSRSGRWRPSGCRDFTVSESALTGETFPVVKAPGSSAPHAQIGQRNNAVFTGTSVRSGTASMLVARTGNHTEFASIAATLAHNAPETEFARGIRRFGYLMTEIMLVIVILVFFANLLLRPPADRIRCSFRWR